uniref:G_PROTEIN_RECEP_F1_2 domain-containing protein n=1 Tax=Bursaphelenchus xylophilus TaxID=6326 RepID=A0A1I7SH09_BURXY
MEVLFDRQEYDRLYNCSLYEQGYFDHMKVPNRVIGLFYILSGLTYISLYIPTIYVMALPKYRKFSCYKIMLFLAVIDSICLTMVCVLYGVFAYKGMVFCDSPMLFYVSGCIGTGKVVKSILNLCFA